MTKLSGIKAVSFDVDGTLWDFDTVQRNALREALLELESHDADAAAMLSVDTLIETRYRVHEGLRGKTSDLVEIRNESFKQALRETGRPDDALAMRLSDIFFEHRLANAKLFADVRPTLETLAPRYRLGLVSNGNSYPDWLGLEDVKKI